MGKIIEKQRHLLDFTLASLWRRKGKNLSLVGVYTLVVFFLASVMFFTGSLKEEARLVLQGAPEMVVQKLIAGRHELIPASYIEKVASIPGVNEVRGRLWGYFFDPILGANYTFMVPGSMKLDAGQVVVGSGVAKLRQVEVGDIITFPTYRGTLLILDVIGILPAETGLVDADLVLLSAPDFSKILGQPAGVYTDLAVRVANPNELATIASKIVSRLPDTRPIIRDEMVRTYDAVFDWRGGVMVFILAASLLAFVIFAWEKASGLSGEEKREIGILKAIGWETSDVLLLKFWEGVTVSLSAFLLGLLLAYFHVFFAGAPLLAPVLKGWSVLYPDFRLTPFIDFSQVFTLFFLAVVPYTVAVIVPSWRAATVDPDLVMRS